MTRGAARIFIGVGGWTYAPWRGTFYPQGLPQARELEHASRHLTSIEINGTYYGSQKPDSFVRWRDATPPGFVFSLKAPRFATNRRELAAAGDSINRFIDSGVLELRDRLGPINWQFLPTKAFDADDFAAFLALLPRQAGGRALRHAVEVRHPSFACDAFVKAAKAADVGIVLAGDSEYPRIEAATTNFVYARIMGTTEKNKLGYGKAALDAWARRLQAWQSAGQDVFCYVISGFKERNPAAAQALLARLG